LFFRRKPAPAQPDRPKQEPKSYAGKRAWPNFKNYARNTGQNDEPDLTEVFRPYRAPVSVIPEGDRKAYDAMIDAAQAAISPFTLGAGGYARSWLSDGLAFLGYPYLAEMAQRAEFRKPCIVITREATREWIKFRYNTDSYSQDERLKEEIDGTNAADERVKAIEKEFERLNIRRIVGEQIKQALLYGIGHVFIDVAAQHGDTDTSLPLRVTAQGVKQGSLRGFRTIEPLWATPSVYNAVDPLRDDFFKPQTWYIIGRQVHTDRLIDMVPYEVSDLLKPAFNFGGLSLTQQIRAYVHNFLRTRNSVSNITSNFSKLVLLTDMTGTMQSPTGSGDTYPSMAFSDVERENVVGRAAFMQGVSEGQDTIVADKNAEDVRVVSTPLGGLNDLQASAMEAMASIPGIPLVKLFGLQPSGLNASSEGEIRVFYDEISAFQEAHVRPVLEKMFRLVQLHLWGEIDKNLSFEFNPLWQLDEEKLTAVEKMRADIDLVNIQAGKISPEEAREREKHSDTSIYAKVDLNGEAPSQSYLDQNADGFRPQDFIGGSAQNGDPRAE